MSADNPLCPQIGNSRWLARFAGKRAWAIYLHVHVSGRRKKRSRGELVTCRVRRNTRYVPCLRSGAAGHAGSGRRASVPRHRPILSAGPAAHRGSHRETRVPPGSALRCSAPHAAYDAPYPHELLKCSGRGSDQSSCTRRKCPQETCTRRSSLF